MSLPAVVFDNGSGYTKMGFSGNMEPSFVIPTCVALNCAAGAVNAHTPSSMTPEAYRASVVADLDFSIGNEAVTAASSGSYSLSRPIQRGLVVDWDGMERLWLRSFYDFLRVDPEQQLVLVSESPLSPPEHREATAEIMFETFNVRGLHIAPQPVLAFSAANAAAQTPRTGVVVDAGADSVSVVPVVEGFMMPGCIRSIPVGGSHLTNLMLHLLKERGEIPTTLKDKEAFAVARQMKETYGYACSDAVKEFGKHEREPSKYRKVWQSKARGSREGYKCTVGVERFLVSEALFSTDLVSQLALAGGTSSSSSNSSMQALAKAALALGAGAGRGGEAGAGAVAGQTKDLSMTASMLHGQFTVASLPQLVDAAIQSAPIDTRRALYKTIVLAGGSTLFKDFHKRLQRDVRKLVDARQSASAASAPDPAPAVAGSPKDLPGKQSRVFATTGTVEVSVITHPVQQHSAWFGGSILATTPAFPEICYSREQYAEYGPSICRMYKAVAGM